MQTTNPLRRQLRQCANASSTLTHLLCRCIPLEITVISQLSNTKIQTKVNKHQSHWITVYYSLLHWYPCLPKPHRNSLQNAQNVGCRKNFATNLWPLRLCVLRNWVITGTNENHLMRPRSMLIGAASVIGEVVLISHHTYFWYLTAPRRFVMLLMRVFVNCASAVLLLLLPKSEMLVRYNIDADADKHSGPLSSMSSPYCSSLLRWLPSREWVETTVLVVAWLAFFHGSSEAVSDWIELFV